MAVFVDLEDDDVELSQPGQNGIKSRWTLASESHAGLEDESKTKNHNEVSADHDDREEAAHESAVEEITHSMTVALGCYP